MNVELDIRAGEASAFVRTVFSDQVPFATSRAINWTALDFQKAQRAHMAESFTIRRRPFMERSVKIKPFSRKDTLEARVKIDSPGGRSDIFAKFETDTSKGPFRGRSLAVPTDKVPRTGAGVIRKPWRPSQLFGENSRQHGRGKVFANRGDVYVGAKKTILIRKPGGRGTIFRRTADGLEALYQLVPRVSIEPVLAFEKTARRTVEREWAGNFTRSFDLAMRTAR